MQLPVDKIGLNTHEKTITVFPGGSFPNCDKTAKAAAVFLHSGGFFAR